MEHKIYRLLKRKRFHTYERWTMFF